MFAEVCHITSIRLLVFFWYLPLVYDKKMTVACSDHSILVIIS